MLFSLQALAMLLPGYIRVGGLHVPVYGLFAAVGLVAALWLSQKTAMRVGIPSDKLWDAGVFAVVAAFIASRLLLIAFDLHSFLKFPLLMLALPSLTYTGMFLTGLMVWVWLRWKRLALLDVLDAWAPCAALLAAVLSLGHFFEGTDAGMPTSLPWGVVTPGDSVLGRVHPVQIYSAVAAAILCNYLLRKPTISRRSGAVAARALFWGGFLSFFLDMLRQPIETNGDAWLDPSQYASLLSLIAGIGLSNIVWGPPLTRTEAAEILENFVYGRGGAIDHEAIEYGTFKDPLLIEVRENIFFGRLTEEETTEMLCYAQRLRENSVEEKSRV